MAPTGGAIDISLSFRITNMRRPSAPALLSASYAIPALIEPSPIIAIASPVGSPISRAMVKPSAAEIDVEEWAAPKGSNSDSARLVKPEIPPS